MPYLPLPGAAANAILQNQHEVDNLFLLFHRYVWTWRRVGDNLTLKADHQVSPKLNFLRVVATRAPNEAKQLLYRVREREAARLDALGVRAARPEYTLDARLVAGFGYKSALEVGLSLHPLYGVPYLPGASVKGVVRAWAEDILYATGELTREDLSAVFGSPNKYEHSPAAQRVGAVTFHDAFPTAWPTLKLDVLTPHYGPWYIRGETPGDWHDPEPTPFLTVASGTTFCFGLSVRPGTEEPTALLTTVQDWLSNALQCLAAGAKTAAGYGYFSPSTASSVPTATSAPEGYSRGTVTRSNPKDDDIDGRITPDDDGDVLRFSSAEIREEDQGQIHKGDTVFYRDVEERDGNLWAVDVHKTV